MDAGRRCDGGNPGGPYMGIVHMNDGGGDDLVIWCFTWLLMGIGFGCVLTIVLSAPN